MESALIGPKVEDSTILDETEYETVSAALKLARSNDREAQALANAIRACQDPERQVRTWACSQHPVLRHFFSWLSDDLGECVDDVRAIICLKSDDPVLLLEGEGERQATAVEALLKIFAGREWLAEFLLAELPKFAKEPPPPMRVIWELVEEANQFQLKMDMAERMLANWRKFIPALKEEKSQAAEAGA